MRSVEVPAGVIEYAGAGSGPPVVLLHGLLMDHTLWNRVLPLLLDQHADLPTAIDAAFAAAADDIANTGWANMCPVATVASEIADTEPELRQVAAEVIASWADTGSRYLARRGLSQADARAAMYALLAALEGGFVLARAQRSAEPLLAAGRAVSAYIATMPVAAQA